MSSAVLKNRVNGRTKQTRMCEFLVDLFVGKSCPWWSLFEKVGAPTAALMEGSFHIVVLKWKEAICW